MSTNPDVTGLNLHSLAQARRANPLRMAPNLLTLLRIFLAPFLVVAVFERRFALAFALFLVAAFTDAMDRSLARWLRQRTMLGQYLDPVADKLLLSSLFLVLTRMGILDPRVTVVVFGGISGCCSPPQSSIEPSIYAISILLCWAKPTASAKL